MAFFSSLSACEQYCIESMVAKFNCFFFASREGIALYRLQNSPLLSMAQCHVDQSPDAVLILVCNAVSIASKVCLHMDELQVEASLDKNQYYIYFQEHQYWLKDTMKFVSLALASSSFSEQLVHSHILNTPVKIPHHDLGSGTQDGNFQSLPKAPLVPVRGKTWMIWLQLWEVLFEIYSLTLKLQAYPYFHPAPCQILLLRKNWCSRFTVSWNNIAFTVTI